MKTSMLCSSDEHCIFIEPVHLKIQLNHCPIKSLVVSQRKMSAPDPLTPYPWKSPLNLPPDLFSGFFFEIEEEDGHFKQLCFFSEETKLLHSPWDEENNRRIPAVTVRWIDGSQREIYYEQGKEGRHGDFLDEDQTELMPTTIVFFGDTRQIPKVTYKVGHKLYYHGPLERDNSVFKNCMTAAVKETHEWIAAQPLTKSANKK